MNRGRSHAKLEGNIRALRRGNLTIRSTETSLPRIPIADDGHTVERCKSAIGAAVALAVCGDDNKAFSAPKSHWNRAEQYWRAQLRHAEARTTIRG